MQASKELLAKTFGLNKFQLENWATLFHITKCWEGLLGEEMGEEKDKRHNVKIFLDSSLASQLFSRLKQAKSGKKVFSLSPARSQTKRMYFFGIPSVYCLRVCNPFFFLYFPSQFPRKTRTRISKKGGKERQPAMLAQQLGEETQ